MSLEKYGNAFDNLLDGQDNYRVLKKIYIHGGDNADIKFCENLVNDLAGKDGSVFGKKKFKASTVNEEHEKMIEGDVNLNCRVWYKHNHDNREQLMLLTPLQIFCLNVNEFNDGDKIVLVEKGAQINLVNKNGKSALHLVFSLSKSEECEYNLCKYLVDKGTNVDLQDKNFLTPIHLSFKVGHEKTIKFLLSKSKFLEESINMGDKTMTYLSYIIDNYIEVSMSILRRLSGSAHIKKIVNSVGKNFHYEPLLDAVNKYDGKNDFLVEAFEEMKAWKENDEVKQNNKDKLKKLAKKFPNKFQI